MTEHIYNEQFIYGTDCRSLFTALHIRSTSKYKKYQYTNGIIQTNEINK